MNRFSCRLLFILALAAASACGGLDEYRPGAGAVPRDPVAEAFEWPHHDRPIVEQNGRTLLWANGPTGEEDTDGEGAEPAGEQDATETQWFDLTDALIDPVGFSHGIGKDTIPSVEQPVFVAHDDPLLAERGVDLESEVLGVYVNGIARAYPRRIMSMHEVVNDEFAGRPYAVLW